MFFTYGSLTASFGLEGGKTVEVSVPKLLIMLRTFIPKINVDEGWYLERYPDVAEAVRSGKVLSAADHYLIAGYFEDRMPHRINVDASWYLDTYPDVKEAIARTEMHSAQRHFETDGFKEGRLPFAMWSLIDK